MLFHSLSWELTTPLLVEAPTTQPEDGAVQGF